MNCFICDTPLTGRQTKYCSKSCKQSINPDGCYSYQKDRGLNRKLSIVRQCGGKCTRCGYQSNLGALVFHHLNPSTKNFQLDSRSLSNRKMEIIMEELSKCILLCSNCHCEIHYPELNLDKLP